MTSTLDTSLFSVSASSEIVTIGDKPYLLVFVRRAKNSTTRYVEVYVVSLLGNLLNITHRVLPNITRNKQQEIRFTGYGYSIKTDIEEFFDHKVEVEEIYTR